MGKSKNRKKRASVPNMEEVGAAVSGTSGQPARRAPIYEQKTKLWPSAVLGVVIFLVIVYCNISETAFAVGAASVLLCAGLIGYFAGWKPTAQVTLASVFFFAFLIMSAAGSLYSGFQEYAAIAFGKWFACFSLFLTAAVVCKRKHTRTLMLGAAIAIGLVAVISIDSASIKAPTDFVLGNLLFCDTSQYGYWPDGRISGMFVNPNVSGSMFGLGVFLSLHLARTARRRAEQVTAFACLSVCAMAFLLSFSMGSIGFFVLGVAVYLITAKTNDRLGVLVLMVETAVLGTAFGIASTVGLGKTGAAALVPDLLMVVCTAALWLLHTKAGVKVTTALEGKGRAIAIAAAAVFAVGILYVVAGFHITGSITLEAGETVTRSAYPAAGDYTLAVDGSAGLNVTITAQNSRQTAMHTSDVLYSGPASGAAYTVPEGTKVVYFALSAAQGGRVDRISYDGAGSGALKLNYLLLPSFVETRIQGLWANQNVIQRGTFNEDALRIWRMNPIFGKGMGAYEAYRPQVAEFHYDSRYVHNEYTQTMAETGIVGLLLFVGVLASFALAAVRGRKDEVYGAMAAPLLACLTMMAGHGTFEVIWSNKPYLVTAALMLALIQITFGTYIPLPLPDRHKARPILAGVCALFLVVFGFLRLRPALAQLSAENASSYDLFMEALDSGTRMNPYGSHLFMLTYMENALQPGGEAYLARADEIATVLAGADISEYGTRTAAYLFARGQTSAAFDALERAVRRGWADPMVWDMAVETAVNAYQPGVDGMTEGMKHLYSLWKEANAQQLDDITLSAMHTTFMEQFA